MFEINAHKIKYSPCGSNSFFPKQRVTLYVLEDQGSIIGRGKKCSFHHRVQTGSEAHPAFYSMGIGDFYPRDKAFGT